MSGGLCLVCGMVSGRCPHDLPEAEELALCEFRLFAGSYYEPPEYCDEPIEPGAEYCPRHEEATIEPDYDAINKDRRLGL